jgi:hypothetical protein
MTIEAAAESLQTRLTGSPWFTAIGVGGRQEQPILYVYSKSLRGVDTAMFEDGWQGYPVQFVKVGTVRPVTPKKAPHPV